MNTNNPLSPLGLDPLPHPQTLQRWPWLWEAICQTLAETSTWLYLIRLPGPWDYTQIHTHTIAELCTYSNSVEFKMLHPIGLIKVPLTCTSLLALTAWSIRVLPLLTPGLLSFRGQTGWIAGHTHTLLFIFLPVVISGLVSRQLVHLELGIPWCRFLSWLDQTHCFLGLLSTQQ